MIITTSIVEFPTFQHFPPSSWKSCCICWTCCDWLATFSCCCWMSCPAGLKVIDVGCCKWLIRIILQVLNDTVISGVYIRCIWSYIYIYTHTPANQKCHVPFVSTLFFLKTPSFNPSHGGQNCFKDVKKPPTSRSPYMSCIRYYWTSFSGRPSFKVLNSSCQGSNLLEKHALWWQQKTPWMDPLEMSDWRDSKTWQNTVKPLNLIQLIWVMCKFKQDVSWRRKHDNAIGNLCEFKT